MSYFAKPNFIIYDEWFDEDLEKTKLEDKTQKITTFSNLHEFFYEQSNNKVGASENNLQLDLKVNEKELITNNYLRKTSEKFYPVSIRKFLSIKKLTKSKIKFYITKRLIYSVSIFSFLFIFGFLLFFVSQTKKNESNFTNKLFVIEKEV